MTDTNPDTDTTTDTNASSDTDTTRRSSRPSTPLEIEAWPTVSADVVERFRSAGETRQVEVGDVLFRIGQDEYPFIYIEHGSIAVIDGTGGHVVAETETGAFVGEIGMLMGQKAFFDGVVSTAGQVIVIELAAIRELIGTVPEIGDMVVSAFAARRQLLIQWQEGGLVIVGDDTDADALRLREFAARNQIPHRWVNRTDTGAVAALAELCDLPATGAAVVTGQSNVLAAPTTRDLAVAIGLDLVADTSERFDVLVIGAGPAGLAASVYAASEGLSVVVVEDTAIGGQAGTSSRIENYLGFPQGVSGTELAYRGEIQAVKFGARIVAPRRVASLERTDDGFDVGLNDDTTITTRTVVFANGVQYRKLPLERLAEFEGRGVYYAATELEARFCRGTQAIIVGGGNSAGQAAMFLSRYAECTNIVVRGDGLADTMSSYLSSRIESDDRIRLWTHTEVSALVGDGTLDTVTLRNRTTGDEETLSAGALFIMIGAAANTDWLDGQIALDDKGFILTGRDADDDLDGYATSLPGVFAVGDIRANSVKRVASAVGEGSVVVSAVHEFLNDLERVPTGPAS